MKRWISGFLCAVLLLLGACGSSPSGDLMAQAGQEPAQPGELTDQGAAALTEFGLNLLRNHLDLADNPLVSPASAAFALGMTANGAQGPTLSQMEGVLGLPVEELNQALSGWRAALPAADGCALHLANAIWLREEEGLTVQPDFLQTAARWYDAAAYKAPFDDATLADINGWVREHTGGMIPSILNAIPQDAMLYLLNALAFEADWETAYEESRIGDWEFTLEDGRTTTVDMMRSTEWDYLEDGQATGFLKYYAGKDCAIAVLLPNEGVSVEEYLRSLTGQDLRAMLTQPQDIEVRAGLPAFEIDHSASLKPALQAMGMVDAFTDSADFSAMGRSRERSLLISEVLHKTFIKVDPKGTKAAAVTAVTIVPTSAPAPQQEPAYKTVILERPFVYFLVDTRTDVPFFAGVLRVPG